MYKNGKTSFAFIILNFIFFCFLSTRIVAQKINDNYNFPIKKAIDKIKIDGILDEKSWAESYVAKDFYMVEPMDTSFAKAHTEVRMTYDNNFLYIAAINYSPVPGKYVVESMHRDWSFNNNDNFFVCIDTYNDLTNGFAFGVNAAGAQWDGDQANGGVVNLNWDNKWYSATKEYPDRWVFEAAIPFKTLRYKKGVMKWGINFSRLDLKLHEKSAWAPMPTNFATATLAYAGNLIWDAPPPKPGLNVSLIPYLLGSVSRDYETETKNNYKLPVGGDAKVGLTSALNLDLTVNPDFSQVEVDQQVTNLSRYELFFPEKRQFFLENSDLFANFGFDGYRPFFSRRIGLTSPINFGARMSGKIDNKWRIGLMDLGTGSNLKEGVPAENYAVAAFQRYIFGRSNIAGIFINRESLNLDYSKYDSSYTAYNREAGLEYNLSSKDNKWQGKFMFHKTFTPNRDDKDDMYAGKMGYYVKNITAEATVMHSGLNYNPEVGYFPRTNFNGCDLHFQYLFFVRSKWLLAHGPNFESVDYFDPNLKLTDNENKFNYVFKFLDRSSFDFGFGYDYVKLLNPFDPTNSGGLEIPAGQQFHLKGWGFDYMSTPSKLFTVTLHGQSNSYYGGTLRELQGLLGYRVEPYGGISLNFAYNSIKLPEPYKSADFWLLGPRLDITFTNKIFFTTFLQYNQQADNFNINSRFQWRFAPVSDIFLVYTENYLPEDFTTKNRAIVLKFTYWYNL